MGFSRYLSGINKTIKIMYFSLKNFQLEFLGFKGEETVDYWF